MKSNKVVEADRHCTDAEFDGQCHVEPSQVKSCMAQHGMN